MSSSLEHPLKVAARVRKNLLAKERRRRKLQSAWLKTKQSKFERLKLQSLKKEIED